MNDFIYNMHIDYCPLWFNDCTAYETSSHLNVIKTKMKTECEMINDQKCQNIRSCDDSSDIDIII